jgi:hypothetical protein
MSYCSVIWQEQCTFDEMMMSLVFIVVIHLNNIPWVDMLLHFYK